MVIMSIVIVDMACKRHKIDISYDSWSAARSARDHILPILNWMMREAIVFWYVVNVEDYEEDGDV